MKGEDVFLKCDMPAGVGFGCVWIIEKISFLVLWVANKYCRNGSWVEFVMSVLMNISSAAKDIEVNNWSRVIG